MKNDHGVTGFSFLWNDINDDYPFDENYFKENSRGFVAVATDVDTGKPEFFAKGECDDILRAVQASATVPYVSEPVEIDNKRYLDGGISVNIPYQWALDKGYDKIVVVRTRDRDYRKSLKIPRSLINREYSHLPRMKDNLLKSSIRYNMEVNNLNQLEKLGRVFVIAPSQPINIKRFEGDLDALANIYWLGYHDAKVALPALKKYLHKTI